MNFLAHLTLPGQSEKMLIGNYMADSFKGSPDKCDDPELRAGIVLHRNIDRFADDHPISRELVQILRPQQGKFAPVVLDIIYDHLLAQSFENFHGQELRSTANRLYQVLTQGKQYYTGHSQLFLPHMIQNDLLFGYQYQDVIEDVLYGMSRRTRYENNMHDAYRIFEDHHALFTRQFEQYYGEFLSALGK